MPDKIIEQLANDLFHLMPMFKNNLIKPLEKTAKTLSPMQIHILLYLKGKEPISMSELAAGLNILKQQMTHLTDKLEENNLIVRIHDKKDRRSVKVSITQSGIDYLNDFRKEALDMIMSKLEQLSAEDIDELHGAMHSIYKIMKKLS
ncbi:MarR family winged helix-turn-helix transcriptional regulator [Lutispora saccharofermentans]|uniref:MarR family transcriptional regulator n=1 Tax=Lutispora saccharofermentans TaxID=3024236 RepID=A0ABT1NMU1_9FIRM|nr:MarR family transcriptional regulator [Lutispora saccharofermentans]MCQ1531606.1 MarR family transcriptional regulator [Lutispora saccharofermentans]